MEINPEELKSYVSSAVEAVATGARNGGGKIRDPIEFDIAIANVKEAGGGLKVYIADAKGVYKNERISRIKFKVQPPRLFGGS